MTEELFTGDIRTHVDREFSSRAGVGQLSPSNAAQIEAAILKSIRDQIRHCSEGAALSRYESVPELHQLHVNEWRDGLLVRFRCMVRDMFDPELYTRVYRLNAGDGPNRLISGLFRDVITDGQLNETAQLADELVGHRHTLCCCTVPGLTRWARDSLGGPLTGHSGSSKEQSVSAIDNNKRCLEEEDNCDNTVEHGGSMDTHETLLSTNKRVANCNNNVNGHNASVTSDARSAWNDDFADKLTCLVKLYDDNHTLLLNQIVEFIGVLSVHPALGAHTSLSSAAVSDGATDIAEMDPELAAHQPPASQVPRLHAINWRVLDHCSPMLDSCAVNLPSADCMTATRGQLLHVLTAALLGDQLAAEVLLCQLTSSVFSRQDLVPLGQMSLNFSNLPCHAVSAEEPGKNLFVQLFVELLEKLVEKMCVLTASREVLNSTLLVPTKDYASNTLKSAQLQLASRTHLLIDETALTTGELTERGLLNVSAISSIIRHQKVEYDFGFHRLPYDTDMTVLTLSADGPSMLPADVKLRLLAVADDVQQVETRSDAANNEMGRLRRTYTALHEYLTDDLLETIRKYLFSVKCVEYNVPDDMQKRIQTDFVEWRQSSDASVTRPDADKLHWMLVMARQQCVSRGINNLCPEFWQRTVEICAQIDDRNRINCRASR